MMRLAFALCALLSILACSSAPDDPRLASVFVVMCADIDPGEDPHPCCTGFAMGDQVVTANHCVPDEKARIVSRSQWVHTSSDSEIGTVVARDEVRDIAWLDAPVDEQLTRGGPLVAGASVAALTASGVKSGTANTLAGDFWLTDLDTQIGESGAAIVDASGQAVGVLSRCLTADGKRCDPHTGIFAELP
jgi:hypothetical protein